MAGRADKWEVILRELSRLELPHFYEPEYDLYDLSTDRRIQVRDVENIAPKETVDRFTIQMSQTEFPPIIVTRDGWLLDGNTRVQSCENRGVRFYPAFVIDLNYRDSSPQHLRRFMILGATLNTNNGLSLTPSERRKAVAHMIAEGWSGDHIARALGINASVITQIRHELNAKEKFSRVGVIIKDYGTPLRLLRTFGKPTVFGLNDAPYLQLYKFAQDAGLGTSEINELARRMRATGSDQGALYLIEEERKEMKERILQHSMTGSAKPPISAQLRRHMGFILKYGDGDEMVLVERNPDYVARHVEMLDKTIAVLHHVKTLQSGR